MIFSHGDKDEVGCIASGPFKVCLDMKYKHWHKLNISVEFFFVFGRRERSLCFY